MSQIHAFFDFDDTLLEGDSILYWLSYYYRQKPLRRIFQLLNFFGMMLFCLRIISSHTLKRIFLYPMGWENPLELDRLAQDFVKMDMARRFHPQVLERLWTHHLLGHKIVILSASGIFYLKHLKIFLPMADIQGSNLIWPNSFSLPKYEDGNLRGSNKIIRMNKLGYDNNQKLSFAYSDHHHDLPLLHFSEFPTCIGPTKKLRAIAVAKGWPIVEVAKSNDSTGSIHAIESNSSPSTKVLARLKKLRDLILLSGTIVEQTCDPVHVAAIAREYAPNHVQALVQMVEKKYPRQFNAEIHKNIFG